MTLSDLNPSNKRIGIMGGTFNPIHIGHLILAENAYQILELDSIIFMPTGCSYLKDPSTILDASTRMELVSAAVEGNDHFAVSDHEIRKRGNTYTSETLTELNEIYPGNKWYFIIGEDSIYNIETWHDSQTIFDKCILVVAPRGHEPDERLLSIVKHLESECNSSIQLLDTPDIDISSSMIRDNLREGRGIRYYVPEAVLNIIQSKGLYK